MQGRMTFKKDATKTEEPMAKKEDRDATRFHLMNETPLSFIPEKLSKNQTRLSGTTVLTLNLGEDNSPLLWRLQTTLSTGDASREEGIFFHSCKYLLQIFFPMIPPSKNYIKRKTVFPLSLLWARTEGFKWELEAWTTWVFIRGWVPWIHGSVVLTSGFIPTLSINPRSSETGKAWRKIRTEGRDVSYGFANKMKDEANFGDGFIRREWNKSTQAWGAKFDDEMLDEDF